MEPKLVIPTDEVQPFGGDWARLLKIISIIMLLFSLPQLLTVGISVYRMLPLATSTDTIITTIRDSGEAFTIGTVLLVGLADLFIAWGAARLYRSRAANVLIFGLWLWLLVWAARVLRNFFENGPLFSVIASTNLLQEIAFASFPALVLLIVREYAGYPLLPRNPLRLIRRWLIE
jgi:hypothetical protein